MSTFRGIVEEFPDITIDYFRTSNRTKPPLAGFLSHVHSDHLQGLDTWRSPFVYCSLATKQIILRLQKRIPPLQQQHDHDKDKDNNYQDGINHQIPPNFSSDHHTNQEQPRLRSKYGREQPKYTYAHLKSILKPLPLQTPTIIELSPEKRIRVTLFDANHCIGAVCFLIEDIEGISVVADGLGVRGDSKAIFYTGDIRAERWWVDALIRHPILAPYTIPPNEFKNEKNPDRDEYDGHSQPIKRLSTLYLDTSYATRPSYVAPYLKPNVHNRTNSFSSFPSKRTGLTDLIRKVARYPPNTLFYFRAWTFGYEEVWIALAAALNTRIHVDGYWKSVYDGLRGSRSRSSSNDELRSDGAVGVDVSFDVEKKINGSRNDRASHHEASSIYYDHITAALIGFHEGNRFHKGCLTGISRFNDDNDDVGGNGVDAEISKPLARTLLKVHSCQRAKPVTGLTAAAVLGAVAVNNTNLEHRAGSGICPVAAAVSRTQHISNPDDVTNTVDSRRRTVGGARVVEIIPVVCRRGDSSDSDGHGKNDWDMYEVGAGRAYDEDMNDMSDKAGYSDAEESNFLPSQITFPYARHSSYPELCYLVSAFRPRSVYPCVIEIADRASDSGVMRPVVDLRDRSTNSAKAKIQGNTEDTNATEQIIRESEDDRRPKGKVRMRSLFGRYCTSDAKFVDDYSHDRSYIGHNRGESNCDEDDIDLDNYSNEMIEEGQEQMTMTTVFSEHEEETQKEHESFDTLYVDCNTQVDQPNSEAQSGKIEIDHESALKRTEITTNNDRLKNRFRYTERLCEEDNHTEGSTKPEISKSAVSSSSSSSSRTIQLPILSSNSQSQAQARSQAQLRAATKKDKKGKHKIDKIQKRKIPSILAKNQTRRTAYEAAMCTVKDGGNCASDDEHDDWSRFGGLVCAGNNHTEMEIEL